MDAGPVRPGRRRRPAAQDPRHLRRLGLGDLPAAARGRPDRGRRTRPAPRPRRDGGSDRPARRHPGPVRARRPRRRARTPRPGDRRVPDPGLLRRREPPGRHRRPAARTERCTRPQPVRPDRDDDPDRPPDGRTRRHRNGSDRYPGLEHRRARARRTAAPRAARRRRRALPHRSPAGAGLSRPPGSDGRAIRRRPLVQRRADVPHRRPGAVDRRGRARLPGPHGPAGQVARPAYRTRRGRVAADRPRRGAPGRRRGARGPALRIATGRLRRSRAGRRVRPRPGEGRAGHHAAVLHGAVGLRRPGGVPAERQRQDRPARSAGPDLRSTHLHRAADPGRGDRRGRLRPGTGCAAGRPRRRLLRSRRQLPRRDAGRGPPQRRARRVDPGAGTVRRPDRRGSRGAGRAGGRRGSPHPAGPVRAARAHPTVAGAAAHVVPQPIRPRVGGEQRPDRRAFHRRPRRARPARGDPGPDRAPRGAAHHLPRRGRHRLPADPAGIPGAARGRADRRAGSAGPCPRTRHARVRRHHRGALPCGGLRAEPNRARAAVRRPSHRHGRVLPASARPRRDGRLRGPHPRRAARLGTARDPVRGLRPVAARRARLRGRAGIRGRRTGAILEAHARRAARPAGPAVRSGPSRAGLRTRPHQPLPRRRGAPRPSAEPCAREEHVAVHGRARGARGAAGPVVRHRGHRDRHPGRRPRRGRPRRPGRHVRQHPRPAHGRAGRAVLRGTAQRGARERPRRVRPRGRAVRTAGGDPRPGALPGPAPAVPGGADLPEHRTGRVRTRRSRARGSRLRPAHGEIRPAVHLLGAGGRGRFGGRHRRRRHLRHRPVRRAARRRLRRAAAADPAGRGGGSVGGGRRHRDRRRVRT